MATVEGSQQVMSSPNAPTLTRSAVSPFTQNVPANITSDSGNESIRENKDMSIGDELLSTIRQTEQLPTAQSFFSSEPSASTSFVYEHKTMNIVVIHPRLLSSSLLSLEDFASPMFNVNTIADPDQDIFRPGWRTSLAIRIRRCVTQISAALGIDIADTADVVNAIDDDLTDIYFKCHAKLSPELRAGELLELLRTAQGHTTVYVVLEGQACYELGCALNSIRRSSGSSLASSRGSRSNNSVSSAQAFGKHLVSPNTDSSNTIRVETATPSPLLKTCLETTPVPLFDSGSTPSYVDTRSVPFLPNLKGDNNEHDMLTQVMGRTAYSDPGTKKRKFPRPKRKITLLKPSPRPALVEPDVEFSAPIKSEFVEQPDPAPSAPIKTESTQETTTKKVPDWCKNASQIAPPQDTTSGNEQLRQTPWNTHDRSGSAFRYPLGSNQLQRQRGYTPKRPDDQAPPPSAIFPPSPGGSDPSSSFTYHRASGGGPSFDGFPPGGGGGPPPASSPSYGGPPNRDYPHGPYWTHYTIDPYTEHETNPATGTIYPWYAVRHELGMTLNHPLELGQLHIDKEAFIAYFIDQHYNPDQHYKSFVNRFPHFDAGEKDLRPYLIPYLYQVSQHCASFAIYAPPPHTLRAGSNIGAWFSFLPPYTKRQATAIFDGLIAQALRSKYSGLVTHPELVSLLQAPRQGYDIIYSLASYAQHPALQEFPDNVREPR